MKFSFFRQWIILLIALMLLGSVMGLNLYRGKQQLLRKEEQQILTQTRIIARNLETQLKTTDQALQGIVADHAFLSDPANHPRANARLTVLVRAMVGVRTLFFTDAAGTILAANRPELIGGNFKHRDYFIEPQQHPDPALLYISPPFLSVLNTYVFNVTRILTDANGQFAGVVTAGIEPEYFRVLLESVLYAPDMIATINHGDGVRFMIIPHREGQAGKNLAVPGSMFTRHKQSGKQENLYTEVGYATGEHRLMALATLNASETRMDKPPCIIAGRKVVDIIRPWKDDATHQGLLFLLITTIAVISVFLAQKRQTVLFRAEQDLAESRQRFVDIFNFMPDATVVFDLQNRVTAWNKAMEEMTGVPKEKMLGQGNNAYAVPFYGERRPTLINMLDISDHDLGRKYSNISRKGALLCGEAYCPALYNGAGAHLWAAVAPLHDADGKRIGTIESIRDISGIKQLEADLKHKNELLANQARVDFLTGIYNRLMFSELLRAELASANRYQTPVAMIMFDIDHFKQINDTFGHNTGDHVLKEMARLVSARIRAHDYFCRWGGEEFLILATKNNSNQAAQLAEILRDLIERHNFGNDLYITVSLGVTAYTHGESPEALTERVDTLLYRAKKKGRNRVEADPTLG